MVPDRDRGTVESGNRNEDDAQIVARTQVSEADDDVITFFAFQPALDYLQFTLGVGSAGIH